jgi:membrane protein
MTVATPGTAKALEPIEPQGAWPLLKRTYDSWDAHNAATMAAALAYYTAFALAPVLILIIAVMGFVFGRSNVQGEVMRQMHELVGANAAGFVKEMLENAARPGASFIATIVSIVTIVISATGVFGELQRAMNVIWNTPPPTSTGVLSIVRERAMAFVMVLFIGLLLVGSIAASAVLSGLGHVLERHVPGAATMLDVGELALSFGLITVLFAMMYKVMPTAKIAWRDVWLGAAATAFLFTLGKYALGLYLGKSAFGSSYGAAGSFAVLLAWVYYSAQILFFGAELTHIYARTYGSMCAKQAAAHGTPARA